MNRIVFACMLLVCLTGCHRVRDSSVRLSKDLFIVVTSPVHAPVAAWKDSYEQLEDGGPGIMIPLLPLYFMLNTAKHFLITSACAGDAAWYPLNLSVGIGPHHWYTIEDWPYTSHPVIDKYVKDPIAFLGDFEPKHPAPRDLKKDPLIDFFDRLCAPETEQ